MNTSDKKSNKRSNDSFDRLIFEDKLRIKNLVIDKELDMLLVIFNNGKLLKIRISDYPKLKKASVKQLQDWKLISGGVGIRWKAIDEDLSMKGFIKTAALNDALRNLQGQGGTEKVVA